MTTSFSGAQQALLAEALHVLQHGQCLIFPTETFFGLGCDALDPEAVRRVYQAKERSASKPLPLIAGSLDMVDRVCDLGHVPEALLAFWPGPLTLVLQARVAFPKPLVDSQGRVAIRISAHPVARELSRRLGHPVTATSANIQHMPPARLAAELDARLVERVAMLLDLPPLPGGGQPSTIVSFPEKNCLKVHREGPVSTRDLAAKGLSLC